jgi:hypothetical protein
MKKIILISSILIIAIGILLQSCKKEHIIADVPTRPTITLLGANPDTHLFSGMGNYVDPGYTAFDYKHTDITASVTYTDAYANTTYCSNTIVRAYVVEKNGLRDTVIRRITGNTIVRDCPVPPLSH